MKMKFGAALLGSAAIMMTAPAQAHESWKFHFDHVLGTSLDIVAVALDEKIALLAAQFVQAEIARLDAVLSGWRPDSELQALNASSSFSASPDLFHVIAASEHWRQVTGGAFSARLGALELAAKNGIPDGLLREIAAFAGNAALNLDAQSRRILRPEAVRFAIDGFAKGYIVDRALDAARFLPGVKGLMIDVGGDLRCWGQAPSGDGWRIGVVDAANCADNAAPVAILKLNDKAVATSGQGNRDQMIFDPRTGLRADHVVMATAVADRAADADALASAFAVLAPSDSLALAEKLPGVAAHIATRDGQIYQTQNWAGMVVAQNTASRPDAKSGAAWPAGFSLKIDYEVPNISGGRRPHPPYVTIWVTNAQGNLVRTLAFYADKARYMPENYIFWNRFGASQTDKVYSVTRPTRAPGRYTLGWDGLDDHGQPVAQGKYTINIEAAREHGGHSIQRIELNLGGENASGEAAGQDELGASKVSYGKSS